MNTTKNNKTAIWFSRHQPTADQIADAAAMGFILVVDADATKTAGLSIETELDVDYVMEFFTTGIAADVAAIFGVFAAPVQSAIWHRDYWGMVGLSSRGVRLDFFAAWNVQRPQEGGKPTFVHKQFVQVGSI